MHIINLSELLGDESVSLAEMLDAREIRAFEQQKILAAYNLPIISFTLNIPGPIKTFPLAHKSFVEGKKLIREQLERNNINIAFQKDNIGKTGYEAFYAVDCNPVYIKKLMVYIEDSCHLGRIFDIDILKINGDKVSRQDLAIPERTCLICEEKAHVCARSRKHPLEEVTYKTIEIMTEYFNL